MNGRIAAPPAAGAAGPTLWRALRSLCLYAAAAIAATAFFFWLHHLGNGIPYELAQQRFAAAPLTGESDSDIAIDAAFEHCQISAMVLAGARDTGGYGPLVDAVVLRGLHTESRHSNYCAEAKAASVGVDVGSYPVKPRYWWGGKAIFAIALRWLSVAEFYRFVGIATGAAWLLFAGAMAIHGPGALAAALPPVAFGLAFAGIASYSGPSNGLPYLWAVAVAAIFALLLTNRRTLRAAPPFCFAAGMASSYLWFFDGHNFLVVALLGMIVWLAREGGTLRSRARQALRCIAIYAAGFVVCFGFGQATKAVVFDRTYGGESGIVGGFVADSLFGKLQHHLKRTVSPERRDWNDLTNRAFVAVTPSMTKNQGGLVIALSVLALGGAVLGAGFIARRYGEFDPASTCLWFIGLILAAGALFMLPNDLPERSARYLSLLLALCWSCFAAVASHLWGRRGALAVAAGALAVAAWPAGAVLVKQRLWQDDVEALLAGVTPVAGADFDIWLASDGGKIIYRKEPCAHGGRPPQVGIPSGGWRPQFFFHSRPKASSAWERRHFKFFEADFAMRDGSRCVAMLSLPDPVRDLKSIMTGQLDEKGPLWAVTMEFMNADPARSSALCGALAAGMVYGNNAMAYAVHVDGGEAGVCSFMPDSGVWDEIADISDAGDAVSLWLERYAREGDHLVWVSDAGASLLPGYDAADLRGRAALREVAGLGSSAVFRVGAGLSGETGGGLAAWRRISSRVPAARSFFDVHVDGRTLVYSRESCARSDTASRFFLHVFPEDAGDLPARHAERGFENLDFDFADVGWRFDGKCVAVRRLPAWSVAYARTGQFDGGGRVWAAEIPFDGLSGPAAGPAPAASGSG